MNRKKYEFKIIYLESTDNGLSMHGIDESITITLASVTDSIDTHFKLPDHRYNG